MNNVDYKWLKEDICKSLAIVERFEYTQELADEFTKWKLIDRKEIVNKLNDAKNYEEFITILYGYWAGTKEKQQADLLFDLADRLSLENSVMESLDYDNFIKSSKSAKDLIELQFSADFFSFSKEVFKYYGQGIKHAHCPILSDIHSLILFEKMKTTLDNLPIPKEELPVEKEG